MTQGLLEIFVSSLYVKAACRDGNELVGLVKKSFDKFQLNVSQSLH